MPAFFRKGQSIIEILIAVAVGALLVVAATSILAPALRVNTQAGQLQAAAALGKELSDNIRVWVEADWHNISNLSTSSANSYYLNTANSPFSAVPGSEGVTVGGAVYSRSFSVSDVQRDASGNVVTSGGFNDPSTKQITVQYATGGSASLGNWSVTTALPAARDTYSSIVNNGFVYAIGGALSAGFTSTVSYAQLNTVGTISNWSSTIALPANRSLHASILNNGYVYAIGGRDGSGTPTSSVVYAKINSDGTISNWSSTTALLAPKFNQESIVNDCYVYNIGGDNGAL